MDDENEEIISEQTGGEMFDYLLGELRLFILGIIRLINIMRTEQSYFFLPSLWVRSLRRHLIFTCSFMIRKYKQRLSGSLKIFNSITR